MKVQSSANLSTRNSTRPGLGSNLGNIRGKPATNHLRDATAVLVSKNIIFWNETMRSLVENCLRFGTAQFLHLMGWRVQ
jgi:hypothetical protein